MSNHIVYCSCCKTAIDFENEKAAHEKCILKKEPEFYCAVNIDQVPKDAVGKEWEFSSTGRKSSYCWKIDTLGRIDDWSDDYSFISTDNRATYKFMRPVQPKPVKHLTIEEAKEAWISRCGDKQFFTFHILDLPNAYGGHTLFFLSQIEENPCNQRYYTKQQVEEELSRDFKCKVVIDEY
jgi:hypothetical protein